MRAGEQFLQDARDLLAAARAARNRARRIAAGEGVLKVGVMLSSDITAPLHAFSAREARVRIELVRLRWRNQSTDLVDGTADVGFVRLPVDAGRLRVLPLYQEGLCVVLSLRHPLAGEDTVGLRALADEPLLRHAGASPAWSAVWNTGPRPDGTPSLRGPDVHDMEEILAYVRAGCGVVMVPESVAAVFPRPDIACVPLTDVPPGTVALAWDGERVSPLVDTFVDATRPTVSDVTRPRPGSAPAP
ncbi:LysR family substrate-binding domain-containing protein [Streptomyces pseudogriseolus]|uniref:LysR family substrate-binding domain-containing protein n=1 Tax=Streptomyces pseudogriseolus TaxID=36817 RepID=UPI003FA322DA